MDNSQNIHQNDGYMNGVENELRRLLEEVYQQYTPGVRTRNNNHGHDNLREIDYLDILYCLKDIMQLYNSNMRDYQRNINLSLQTVQMLIQGMADENNMYTNNFTSFRGGYTPPTTTPNVLPSVNTFINNFRNSVTNSSQTDNTRARNNRNNDHLFSYVLYRPTIRNQDAAALRSFFQNIVVHPTQEQIENATELITYDSSANNINTSCPITLEEFQDGDILRQIRHCHHSFFETPIQNWFRSNVRCPVCRYDIRDFVLPTGERGETNEPSPEENSTTNQPSRTPSSSSGLDQMAGEQQSGASSNLNGTRRNISELNNIRNMPGFQELLQELSDNFAVDIHNLLNENLPNGINQTLVDSSQNFVFEFQVEGNLHNE